MVQIHPTPVDTEEGEGNKNNKDIALAVAIPLVIAFLIISTICICFWKRRRRLAKEIPYLTDPEQITSVESILFDLSTLRDATANFSTENKLGEGGFGAVYKGILPDGREIAVKRLSTSSGQGIGELKKRISVGCKASTQKNLVRIFGVCLEEQEKMLVYEYVPNRSLDTILFDSIKREQLDWQRRYKIISGIARGLLYLHEDSQPKIIHRDLKASNILLDDDMNPKISDFGLARLFVGDQLGGTTRRVVGTFGYMAPEYALRGQYSAKSDIFSFGVLVLEILTGQKNSNFLETGLAKDLLSYTWQHWRKRTISEIIDPSLGDHWPRSEVLRCIHIGLLCVQEVPASRPSMSMVVLMLNSYSMSLQAPSKPAFL
ncbi:cysteine-rich receptor-like protein kinase 6 [Dioscorea cayenensis subsp. rotundata]|uniref:Cysteine-rich receptor-like protein kinase 6 n=1 Tax=Dioscorea cayennensis subsp. rotundata TaxID=55577 RepID=A0AB40CNN9_DIOCR|nr:cysteine-rich receptor-like protein kinase 6 [Dioscorea cayenensis subsp. rotundata]